MRASRRELLALLGGSTLSVLSGCAASSVTPNSTEITQTAQPTDHSSTATFEAQLVGPETEAVLFDETDVASVGTVREQHETISLPIALTTEATAAVSERFRTVGIAENPDAYEIVITQNGSEINRFGISPGLADTIVNDQWDGRFLLVFENREQATNVREILVGESTEK